MSLDSTASASIFLATRTSLRSACFDFVALIKRVIAAENADDLRARIMRYLANEPRPEFSEIRILRGIADIDGDTPRFLRAYLAGSGFTPNCVPLAAS